MLNLAAPAYEAVQKLKNNSDWRTFVDSLIEQQSALMHIALEAPDRHDATGYARGVRDVVSLILHYEKSTRGGLVPRAAVKVKEHV